MHRITRLLSVAAAILAATALTATSASASTVPSHPAAGVYNISPAHTLGATVLDVAGASTGNAGVGQWKKYGALGALNQRFRIEPYTTTTFGTPVYRILPHT